jgi:putative transposase
MNRRMKRKQFTEEQINAVLKEHEAGAKTTDLNRKHGISEAMLYDRRQNLVACMYRRPSASRALDDENAKVKKLLPTRCSMRSGADHAQLRDC